MTLEAQIPQSLLICGLLASDRKLLDSIESTMQKTFGEILLRSEVFPFDWTDYYNAEIGQGILRKWVVFMELRNLEDLWRYKQKSCGIENELSIEGRRIINIDPGFIRLDGLWLLSTKPAGHRAYLDKEVWIELTLRFFRDGCEEMPWTYPDHREGQVQRFFLKSREMLKKALKDV